MLSYLCMSILTLPLSLLIHNILLAACAIDSRRVQLSTKDCSGKVHRTMQHLQSPQNGEIRECRETSQDGSSREQEDVYSKSRH